MMPSPTSASPPHKKTGINDEKNVVGVAANQDSWNFKDTLIMVFDLLAAPTAFLVGLLAIPKRTAEIANQPVSRFVRYSSFPAYLMYVAPNYTAWQNAETWSVITNDAVTLTSIIKTGIDAACLKPGWTNISSWVEFFINLVWLVPAGGGIGTTKDPAAADWTLFAANVAFDVGGMMTPFVKDPKFFAASEAFVVAYGALGAVTGVLYYESRHQRKTFPPAGQGEVRQMQRSVFLNVESGDVTLLVLFTSRASQRPSKIRKALETDEPKFRKWKNWNPQKTRTKYKSNRTQ